MEIPWKNGCCMGLLSVRGAILLASLAPLDNPILFAKQPTGAGPRRIPHSLGWIGVIIRWVWVLPTPMIIDFRPSPQRVGEVRDAVLKHPSVLLLFINVDKVTALSAPLASTHSAPAL